MQGYAGIGGKVKELLVPGALSGGSVSSSGNVDGASIGSGATPVTAGDLTAFGNVSLNDTAFQGNVSVASSSALINLSGAGSVLVPAPSSNNQASTKKYVDDALDNYAPMVRTTGNQYDITGYKKFLNEPFAYLVSSQMKQYTEQTAFLEVCTDGAFSKAVIFEFTESSGGGRAICKFNITSGGVITETHTVLVGAIDSIIGVVRYDGKVYLTLNGYGVFSNLYIRAGGNRRQNPVEIETPFSVADTDTYPNQLVISW